MPTKGSSVRWTAYKANVKQIFMDKFLPSAFPSMTTGIKWEDLSEEFLTDLELYKKFAHYLTDTYIIEKGPKRGKRLMLDPARQYVSTMINAAIDRFKATSDRLETRIFSSCLDAKSTMEIAVEYQGLRKEMTRRVFQRNVTDGEHDCDTETITFPEDVD